MTDKQIIIDDVDVYECEHLREEFTEFYLNDPDIDYINYCCAYTNECKKYSDCYYKQLKRKEQECERLKEEKAEILEKTGMIETLQGYTVKDIEYMQQQLDQLKADNDELKKDYTTAKGMYDLCQSDFMELAKIKDKYKQALQEIKDYCNKYPQNSIGFKKQILQKCEEVEAWNKH